MCGQNRVSDEWILHQFSLNDINPSAKVWPLVVGAVAYALQEGLAEFHQSGKISFDDMVCYPASLAEIPVCQFDHVIIDEAQDLNKAQLRLVRRACHPDTVTGHKASPFRDAKIRQKIHSLAVFAGEITSQVGGSAS